MDGRFAGISAAIILLTAVTACDQGRDARTSAPPPRQQFIRFEYQIAPADSVSILELNQNLQNGEMVIEEATLGEDANAWCRYEGSFNPTAAQVDPDLLPLDQTQAPVLNSFGNPRSMGFNFLISGVQSRNRAASCGTLDNTVQGIDLTSSQGSASGTWRPGDQAMAVIRPDMGDNYLGKALEFTNTSEGIRLFFDHAVDSVSPHGYIQGRFCFLAVSSDGGQVILVRNGEFGMQGQR